VGPAATILSCFSCGISWSYQDVDSTSTHKNTNKVAKEKIAPSACSRHRALLVHRVQSNYEGSSIAINRESVFEVGPARAGRSSLPRRPLAGRQNNGWRWHERSESLLVTSILKLDVSPLPTFHYPQHLSEVLATLHSPGRCDGSTDCSTMA
jgi:hypothetical protein